MVFTKWAQRVWAVIRRRLF